MIYRTSIFYLSLSDHFPSLYFALVLLALIPLSCLVAFQLFQVLKRDMYFYWMRQKIAAINTDDRLFGYLSVLVKKKLWLDAIKVMEKKYVLKNLTLHRYFNALGFIYYSMQEYNLAQLYYLRALEIQEDYLVALQNLAKIYKLKKETTLLMSTYRSILKYDPTNKIAVQHFKISRP